MLIRARGPPLPLPRSDEPALPALQLRDRAHPRSLRSRGRPMAISRVPDGVVRDANGVVLVPDEVGGVPEAHRSRLGPEHLASRRSGVASRRAASAFSDARLGSISLGAARHACPNLAGPLLRVGSSNTLDECASLSHCWLCRSPFSRAPPPPTASSATRRRPPREAPSAPRASRSRVAAPAERKACKSANPTAPHSAHARAAARAAREGRAAPEGRAAA